MASQGKKFSSRLMDMKFMKRGVEKKNLAAANKRKAEEADESHWVANQSKRCNVVMEGDPPPGALVGRLSFKSFNPSIHRLQEEAEEHLVKLKKDVDAEGGEYSVSDNEMAQTIAKRHETGQGIKAEMNCR